MRNASKQNALRLAQVWIFVDKLGCLGHCDEAMNYLINILRHIVWLDPQLEDLAFTQPPSGSKILPIRDSSAADGFDEAGFQRDL